MVARAYCQLLAPAAEPMWAMAAIAWLPTLYMPQNMAGNTASHTMIIMRFRSSASRTWEALRVTLPGV